MSAEGRVPSPKRQPVTDDVVWCDACENYHLPNQHDLFSPEAPPAYDREVLVSVLVYHYRKDHASCGCGWAELARSHPEHVATVYEESVLAKTAPASPSSAPGPS